jgi:DNA-binding MarR family transcriptional regulator
MRSKADLEKQVFTAARDQGVSSVLFRNAMSRKLGLNVTDSECLGYLTITGETTPTEIARYTGLTTGSTTAMLDRLERAEFIKRKPNPKDRRGILIEINKRWTETVRPLVAGVQKAQGELIASYSAEELEIIADYLRRFTENAREHTAFIENDIT